MYTPRRVRLLCDAQHTTGKIPQKQLLLAHNTNRWTGYRIIKPQSARRGNGVHNRGRKPVLSLHERNAIETVGMPHFASQAPPSTPWHAVLA
jgi:hypothetical protein